MVSAEFGGCYRRVLWAGWITVAGLIVLATLSWAGAVHQQLGNARILLFLSLALPAVFYVRAINAAEMVSVRVIVLFGAMFALIGFITLPFDSTDVFYYIAQGWQQSQYEHNPYSHVLRDVPNHLQ